MTRSQLALVMALAAAACVPQKPAAPEPSRVVSPLAPAQVVQRAAATLVALGFTVAASDANAGVLTATQDREAVKMAPEVRCYYGPDAVGARGTTLRLTVSVSASPSASGSAVVVATKVRESQSGGSASISTQLGSRTESDDSCVSTGELEKRLGAVLSTP